MTDVSHAALVIALALVAGVAFVPALALSARPRLLVLVLFAAGLFCLPLLASSDQRLLRAILAIVCATTAVRLYDLHVGALRGARPAWRARLAFLVNQFCLVQRKLADEPATARGEDVRRLIRGVVASAAGYLALRAAIIATSDGRTPFLIEHAAKALLVFVVVYGIGEAAVAVWRLAGLQGRTMMANFFLARTPAEFWRLYNRPAGQFLHEDMYRRLRGRGAAGVATLATFVVNGLIHEYIAAIAIGRVQGFQLAFFVIQGVAVALTQRLHPRGAAAVIGWGLTLAFNIVTSVLFFASANQILEWYSSAAPAWAAHR